MNIVFRSNNPRNAGPKLKRIVAKVGLATNWQLKAMLKC